MNVQVKCRDRSEVVAPNNEVDSQNLEDQEQEHKSPAFSLRVLHQSLTHHISDNVTVLLGLIISSS